MKAEGGQKCAATHCTGDAVIDAFAKAFGDNFIQIGVGSIIRVEQ